MQIYLFFTEVILVELFYISWVKLNLILFLTHCIDNIMVVSWETGKQCILVSQASALANIDYWQAIPMLRLRFKPTTWKLEDESITNFNNNHLNHLLLSGSMKNKLGMIRITIGKNMK